MKNKQQGFIATMSIIVVIILIGLGIYFYQRPSSSQTVSLAKNDANVDTEGVKETKTLTQATTSVLQKNLVPVTQIKTVTEVDSASKKNIYSNVMAGYSFELPTNWIGTNKPNISDPNMPELSGAYFGVKGLTADQQGFSFDIQTSSRKQDVDNYKQKYQKDPTNNDLFNLFIETQKSAYDGFDLQNSKRIILNGVDGYEATALFSGGGGTMKFYVFYSARATYRIQIVAVTNTWKSHEDEVLGVVRTFKIQ